MATLEELKKKADIRHPEWDDETRARWAESQFQTQNVSSWIKWNDQTTTIEQAAEAWTQVWQKISDWAHNVISDEEARDWDTFTNFADKAIEIWWDIAWWMTRALWSMPKFWWDAVWLATGRTKFWFWDTKKRAEELEANGMDTVNAWMTAVEEWAQKDNLTGSSDNLFAQSVDQLINNPLALKWVWALFKWAAKTVRAVSKVGKLWKAIEKIEKWVWAVANVADDAAKAGKAWKTAIQTVKEWAKNVVKKVTDNKVTNWLSNKVGNAASWVLWPAFDFGKPIISWIKAATKWYKAGGIWWAIRAWVWETLASWLDTAGNFIANPYSYRMPRIWSYDQAQRFIWNADVARANASDMQEFMDDHGYSLLNATSFKDNDALTKWYDEQGIPEDKRVTLDEANSILWKSWDSFTNNLLTWMKDLLQFMDPWTYNQWYYNAVKWSESWIYNQVETTPRWRLRTAWWLSIDLTDWTITDSEWNIIDTNNLTKEQQEDFAEAIAKVQTGDYSDVEIEWQTPETQEVDNNINITWLAQDNTNNIAIESMVQNWMLTQKTVDTLMHWNKSADAVYITTQLNEASKQFAHQLVNLYTADEMNKDPQLQEKVMEHLWAYQRWLNATAEIIDKSKDEVYWQKKWWVYRFREAMSDAMATLSERDQSLINSNIYRQAIDYNNWLEVWFDETWMKAATSAMQNTDDFVVNKLLRDDSADVIDALWLHWLWDTAVNPNVVWAASMLWDVRSAVASNAAYLIDTAVVNFLNNNLVEWYLWKLVNKGIMNKIMPARVLANKQYNFMKWFASEASSEPLENFLDAISMVESADTNYDFMPWLLIGALQWWFAGYAWAKSSYSSINDYFSDPKNRTDILNRMWIDISKISDPKKKALALDITNQMFDNVVEVMKNAYANANYWVENLAQSLAVTLINNDMADYATDILNQAQNFINEQQEIANQTNNWVWTEEQITNVFWDQANFDAYQKWENFSFSQNFIDNLRTQNEGKFNAMKQRAESLVVTAQSVKWNSLQEVFDKMAPKVDINWLPIRTPLSKEQLDATVTEYNSMTPGTPATQQYVVHQMIQWANVKLDTIADILWIWEDSEAWDSNKWDFKKTIKRKTADWKEERISIRDYIIERINDEDNWLTQEQRAFIANMLFRTSSLWINSYFTDSWALSRLGKDFFNSVMPAIEWSKAAKQWFDFIARDQVTKVSNAQQSKEKALKERWEETHKIVDWQVVEKSAQEIYEETWDTRENWIEWDPDDVIQLTETANYVKSHLPRAERKQWLVNIPLNKDPETEESVEIAWITVKEKMTINGIELWKDENTDANINSDEAKSKYQRVKFTYEDWTTKEYYVVPQLNYEIRNQAEDEQADDWFNSFVLLSTDPEDWETIHKRSSVIFRWPDEKFARSKNVIYDVLDKEWKPVKWNRVINFTHNPISWWRIATVIQLNRLSKNDRESAYSKWQVFVVNKHNEEVKWKKKNYWKKVVLPNGKEVDYDTREIYTVSDMLLDPNATWLTIWDTTYQIWWKYFDRQLLVNQNTTDEITDQTPEELQEKNEQLIRYEWAFIPKATTKEEKAAVKALKDSDSKPEEILDEWVKKALSETDDPNISEEESINNYNKSIDQKTYDKARMKIHLIAMNAKWFPIWDYLDLNLLSSLIQIDRKDTKKYLAALKKVVIWDVEHLSPKDAYNLYNRVMEIEENFEYLDSQYPDQYDDAINVIWDMADVLLIEFWIWDKLKTALSMDDQSMQEFNWTDAKDFVHSVFSNWYAPIELWISADENWKILNVNFWTKSFSWAIEWTKIYYHNHPNGSFFSYQDLMWAKLQWLENIGLILPGSVFISFPTEDKFTQHMYNEAGAPRDDLPTRLDQTILDAIKFSLDQNTFDWQDWWDFDSLAQDMALAYDWQNISEADMQKFEMEAKTIAHKVYKKLWKDLKNAAIESWDIEKWYFFNESTKRKMNAITGTSGHPLLSDSPMSLTDIEKQTTERYLDQFYEVSECKTAEDFANLRRMAKANDWIYTLREYWNKVNHFWNPFWVEWSWATVVVASAEEAVNNYFDWLTGRDFKDVEPNRRQWIVDQILNWSLRNKKLYYYTNKVTASWNEWNYSKDSNFWNTKEYSYKQDYNEFWWRAYNHAMILWMLINTPQYINHADRLRINLQMESRLATPFLKRQFKEDQMPLLASNKIIWYSHSKLFTPLLYWYKEWNQSNTNVYDYNSNDIVYVKIPHYSKYNKDVSDQEYKWSVQKCVNAAIAKVKVAIEAWAQFTTGIKPDANEWELFNLLKDNWYVAHNMNGKYLHWTKSWEELNKVNNPSIDLQRQVEAIFSNEESEIIDQIEKEWLTDPHTNNIEEKNTEVIDMFSNILDENWKSRIVEDMNALWLSLELLDSKAISAIVLAYVNWKWLEDAINYMASQVRTTKLDNYLRKILIKNWVLDEKAEYDWDTVDLAISKQWALTWIKNLQYKWQTNLNEEEIRSLSNSLFNSKYLNGFSREDKIKFVWLYVKQQILGKGKNVSRDDFVKKQEYKMWIVVDNFKAQWHENINESSLYEAIIATDWIYWKEEDIIDSLTEYFIQDVFHRNYNTASEDFKNKIRKAIRDQMLEDKVVVLENPYSVNNTQWYEFISEIAWMPDEVRFAMANQMREKNVIWKWVYNYLMKTDPTTTILNEEWWVGLLWSVIIKQVDNVLWDSIETTFATPSQKIDLFLSTYRYYAMWWSSYEWLIRALEAKYQWDPDMTRIVQEFKKDMEQSKYSIFSEQEINNVNNEPLIPSEWEDNPYEVFIRKIEPTDPNVNNIAYSALIRLYYADISSFNSIIQYAPKNIKKRISDWMEMQNAREHWSNKALWMVMSFLSSARNKEILSNIAAEMAEEKSSEWMSAEVNSVAKQIMLDYNDDTIMVLPDITANIYKETWIVWLDLNRWTVLFVWDKQEFKPSTWTSLDWKQVFPLKTISSLDQLNADVNVIVPNGIRVPAGSNETFRIVRATVWIKDWMMVRSPTESFKNDLDAIWNTISWLWKVWHKISIKEWFTLTDEQNNTLKKKKLTKNFYWKIYNEVIVPTLPEWVSTLSQRDFNKMISEDSMKSTKLRLLQAIVASKSIDDKINAATIIINQVTNWKLALHTDSKWTVKSIDMEWAAKQFEKMLNDILDPSDENYNKDKRILWNFFAAYYSTLMSFSHWEWSTRIWISKEWFNELSKNYQSAMWLLKDLWEKKWYAISKYAYLKWENPFQRMDESIQETTVEEMWQMSDEEIAVITDREIKEMLWQYVNDAWEEFNYEESEDTWYDWVEQMSIESENFEDKDAEVFATLFNDVIVDNLYDVEDYNIQYDNEGNNKFVSNNLLSVLNNNDITIIESESTIDMDQASMSNDIWIADMLALQTIISSNSWNNEDLETFLDQIFQMNDWAPDTSPVKQLFNKAKQEILKDPDNAATVIKNLLYNDKVDFSVIKTKMITTQKYDKSKTKTFKKNLVNSIFRYNVKPTSNIQLEEIKKNLAPYFTDKEGNQLKDVADDQAKAANEIITMYNDREWDNKKTIYIPGLAWAWKTTMLWAALKAIQAQEWAYADDVSRIKNWNQKAVTNNFSNADAKNLLSLKNRWDEEFYIKVHNNSWDIRVKFKWSDIVSHDELKSESDIVWKYWEALWWVWPDNWIMRLLEIWEDNDRWNRSETRLLINNITLVDDQEALNSSNRIKSIVIHWLWNNIPSKQFADWHYQGWTQDKIEWKSRLKNIFILTKTHSTVQSINDVMWDNGLVWVNSATMDSRLDQKDPSWFGLYWYWSHDTIKDSKELENCLILIDESQNTDDPTIQAIIDWYSDKNMLVFLWDPHQRSQWSVFSKKVQQQEEVVPLNSLYRWTKDIQDVNKLNALWQNDIIGSWYVAILPSDSKDFKQFDNPEDVFDLPWTTMYAVRTNERLQEVNEAYFNWATKAEWQQVTKIISWWQTWADKAWLQIAKALWISTGWTAPKWWKVEWWSDVTLQEYWLTESESEDYMVRTRANVDNSDWTIIIAKDINSSWTKNTIDYANSKDKPVFIIKADTKPDEIKAWLTANNIKTLNVAGNRWSKFKTWEIKVYGRILKDALTTEWKKEYKPIPTMVVDAVEYNKVRNTQSTNQNLMNKRNHKWIDLSTYKSENIAGKDVYTITKDWWIEVFVPVLKDTNASTVKPIMKELKKKYPKQNISITTTAFAVTTAKESWKTVDNIILDWEITNPTYDFYTESNTREAYDSFTRWDKKVYFPSDSRRILLAPMAQISALINDNNPNIEFIAPSEEVSTTEKDINIPIFYANTWAQPVKDILNSVLELLWDDLPFEEVDTIEALKTALDEIYWSEQLYNRDLEWDTKLLDWIKKQLAQFIDKYDTLLKDKAEWDFDDMKVYNKISWWVYGKTIKTPNIESWAYFTSSNSSHKKYSFENLAKADDELKNWHRWMFLVPKKTINAKWQEVYTASPAEITRDVKNIPGVLNNNKQDNIDSRKREMVNNRSVEYSKAFSEYQSSWSKESLNNLLDMLETDIMLNSKDEVLSNRREVSTYNWLYVDPEWLKKFWIDRIDDSVISAAMALAYRQAPIRDADWHIIPDSDQNNLAQTLLNIFSWRTDSEWNPITSSDIGKIIKTRVLRWNDVVAWSENTINSYEELIPNALWTMYQSIQDRLEQWDRSDTLRKDLIDFANNINSIDLKMESVWQNEQDKMYTKDMMIEVDEQTTCKL